MVDGDLFYTEKEGNFVILEKKEGSTYHTKTFLDGKVLEPQNKKEFNKVKTNNGLRSVIKLSSNESFF